MLWGDREAQQIKDWSIPEMKGQLEEIQRSLFFISQVSYKREDELLFILQDQKHRICLEVYTWLKKRKLVIRWWVAEKELSIDIPHSKKKIFFLKVPKVI